MLVKRIIFMKMWIRNKLQEVNRINYILPIAALVAIGVTFVKPSWSPYSYFLIIILKMTFNRI